MQFEEHEKWMETLRKAMVEQNKLTNIVGDLYSKMLLNAHLIELAVRNEQNWNHDDAMYKLSKFLCSNMDALKAFEQALDEFKYTSEYVRFQA